MQVPSSLTLAFDLSFEQQISQWAYESHLMPELNALQSSRFLRRNIVPHVLHLSQLFNQRTHLHGASYWQRSAHPQNLRFAYLLAFMPPHLYRTACVWSELSRLGFQWPFHDVQALEFGSGPASGVCGVAAGEHWSPMGLPSSGTWALIEKDRKMLEWGCSWAKHYSHLQGQSWTFKPFHRNWHPKQPFLPPRAPRFHLWLMSFFLNEIDLHATDLARQLTSAWNQHLESEGLIILIEPALKEPSRALLELRKQLLLHWSHHQKTAFQILLPCLGHQVCGALENPEDWCHESVTWWRPPYLKKLDQMTHLDHKTLPFSYLVIAKSSKSRSELLPHLKKATSIHRLVSPPYLQGKDSEFFVCGSDGKYRMRYLTQSVQKNPLQRGSLLLNAQIPPQSHPARLISFDTLEDTV